MAKEGVARRTISEKRRKEERERKRREKAILYICNRSRNKGGSLLEGGGWSALYTQSLHRSFASCARPLSPFLLTPPSPLSLLSVCARVSSPFKCSHSYTLTHLLSLSSAITWHTYERTERTLPSPFFLRSCQLNCITVWSAIDSSPLLRSGSENDFIRRARE